MMKEKDTLPRNVATPKIDTTRNEQGTDVQLRESEERYQALFEQAAMGIVYLNAEGQVLQANQKLCNLVGYSHSKIIQKKFQDLTYVADLSTHPDFFHKLLTAEQSSHTLELRFLHKDGSPIWVRVTVSRYESRAQKTVLLIGFVEDIHAQKQKELGLLQQVADEQRAYSVSMVEHTTARRLLEQRTQRNLEGLLKMAATLVQLPDATNDIETIGLELAIVTKSMLDCQWVGMCAIDPETQRLRMFSHVGSDQDQGLKWLSDQCQNELHLEQLLPSLYVERLRNNKVVILHAQDADIVSNLPDQIVHAMLFAPIYIGAQLLGLVALDYDQMHSYTADELALANAIAKLAALIIERQHLLKGWTEAKGRVVALREANSRMEEFLGIASHELRTPLTTIKANTQLAMRRLKGLLAQPEIRESNFAARVDATYGMLERAERQISVLNRLVSDMIDISRIQTGRLQIQMRHDPCNLLELVRNVVREQQKVTPERTIDIRLPQVEQLLIMADPDRIRQVLGNYLSNALKYSVEEQPLSIEVELDIASTGNTNVILNVCDHGQGLSEEDQLHVWECFYQSPNVRVLSGSGVGLGLGLFISQALIKRHGGQVGVKSRRGEGSTFWFTLPLASV